MYWWQGKKYNKLELEEFLRARIVEPIAEWEQRIIDFALNWLNEKNEIFEVKTSGSTGIPKSIILTRQQMKESAHATGDFLNLKSGDSCLLVLPAEFIAGKMMIVRAMELGIDLYYYPPQVSVFDQIDKSIDFAAFIPLQIQYAIDSGQISKLNQIQKSIIGGAALSEKYTNRLKKLQTQLYATYGMTETITHVAMKDLKKENSNFTALPGITFRTDQNQCLQISSERLPESLISTTDIVELKSRTEFILKGRFDHIINSGGLKIIPEEIEEAIHQIIGEDSFVGYREDEKLGQKLVLVLESTEQEPQNILKKISKNIPKNKCPKEIRIIPSFLRTENQKIDRKKMQEWIFEVSQI